MSALLERPAEGQDAAPAIRRAAVIGAGVMGAGIAAHLANAGLPVVLLDVAEDGPRRSRRAEEAVERQLAAGGFMHPSLAARVTPGNIEDDLGMLADADWIVEAVAERIEIKRPLFAKVEAVRKEGSVVSSNTSTLPLAALTEGQGPRFVRDFLVTHFFNPPRHMRLLELVAGPGTRPGAVEAIRRFADVALGKGVVDCKDRPGFVANRIGCFWFAAAVSEAVALGLTVEEADAVLGRPFGLPPTGVFGLLDLVGVDLMPQVWGSLARSLPSDDPMRRYDLDPPLIRGLIERGLTGRKAGAGFYRMAKRGGVRVREALDLATGEYRDAQVPALESLAAGARDLRTLLDHPDRGGRYAWRVMGPTLAYAASLIPEVADDPSAADEAMRLGYAWSRGPFELLDTLGPAWFAGRLADAGERVPPLLREAVAHGAFYRTSDGRRQVLRPVTGYRPLRRPVGSLSLADLKVAEKPVTTGAAASLWDLGDGVACLEFHTKANTFDPGLLTAVEGATAATRAGFRALVLGNDAAGFSAGADLKGLLDAARRGDWAWVEDFVQRGHRAFRGLKFAPFPVVAAVSGAALGGGCEIALHADAIQAHAEVTMGLVEAKVGLVPGWGGCRELWLRAPGTALRTIAAARTSASALDARDLGFLRERDGITMNRDRLLADAKAMGLRLAGDYRAPEPALLRLPERQVLMEETAGDEAVRDALATILSADGDQPVPEEAMVDRERVAFMALIRREETLARIAALVEPRRI